VGLERLSGPSGGEGLAYATVGNVGASLLGALFWLILASISALLEGRWAYAADRWYEFTIQGRRLPHGRTGLRTLRSIAEFDDVAVRQIRAPEG